MLDAQGTQPVRHLEPAGPAAHDDDRVVARRERPAVRRGRRRHHWFRKRFALRRRRAIDWSIRNETRGFEVMKPSTRRAGEHDAAERPQRDDIRRGGFTQEDRHLAEEVAPVERGALLAVDEDRGVALEDDVEARSGQPLAEDAFARPGTAPPRRRARRPGSCGVVRSANSVRLAIASAISSRSVTHHSSRRARPGADDATRASAVDRAHGRGR